MIVYKIRRLYHNNEISYYDEVYNSLDKAKSLYSYIYNNFNTNDYLLEIVEFELVEKTVIK